MQKVKKQLLELNGLDKEITPQDDGTYGIDVLLTEEQSNSLIQDLTNAADEVLATVTGTLTETVSGVTGLLGRKRRNSYYFEENTTPKWNPAVPIPYTFDASVAASERDMVHNALKQIQAVSCIKFQYSATQPSGTNHLYYTKFAQPGFCGLSYIGKVSPANPIYLSFACQDFTGVVMHETFHALGVNHHHIRGDRDNFISINWDNVNPQQYDYFAIADSSQYTSYGTTYDYGSIMHYNGFVAGVNPTEQTMIPRFSPSTNTPLMGQRKALSQKDILLLNRMYCRPATCQDHNLYCGAWALANHCLGNQWVHDNCKKSCGTC